MESFDYRNRKSSNVKPHIVGVEREQASSTFFGSSVSPPPFRHRDSISKLNVSFHLLSHFYLLTNGLALDLRTHTRENISLQKSDGAGPHTPLLKPKAYEKLRHSKEPVNNSPVRN